MQPATRKRRRCQQRPTDEPSMTSYDKEGISKNVDAAGSSRPDEPPLEKDVILEEIIIHNGCETPIERKSTHNHDVW